MTPCKGCRRESWVRYRFLGERVVQVMAGAVCQVRHGGQMPGSQS